MTATAPNSPVVEAVPDPDPAPTSGPAPARHRRGPGAGRHAARPASPTQSTRRRLSLRVRITGVAMLVMVVVLALASVGLVQILEHALLRQTDDGLVADADGVAQVVRAGNAPRNGLPERYVQFATASGKVIGTNDVAQGMPLLVPHSRVAHVRAREIFSRKDPAIGRLRVIVEPFDRQGSVVLIVARPINQLSDTTRSLTQLLELGVPLLSIALGFVIWQMVGRALRPVEQVRATVSDISAQDLSRRVPSPGTGDEIDRLTATVNEMLDRLESSMATEQRFIADASHELRSPIAGMRALLESASPGAAVSDADRAEVLSALGRLQAMADQLLELAREGSAAVARRRPVDLDEIVLAQAAVLRRTTTLEIDSSGVSGGQVLGDGDQLGQLVENLATNAARHARSVIRLGVSEDDHQVRLVIADDGPGIPPADRTRVFDRFTRLDHARSRDDGGAGLGLAIVARIVAQHEATVTIDEPPGGGARFTVVLPISRPAEPEP